MQHYKKSLMITLVINRVCMAVWIACVFLVPQIARWYDMYSNKNPIFTQLVILMYLAMMVPIQCFHLQLWAMEASEAGVVVL